MRDFSKGTLQGAFIAALMLLGGAPLGTAASASARGVQYEGEAVTIGRGSAHVVVQTGTDGSPRSVSIEFTPGVLEGLPTGRNRATPDGAWEYVLPVPETPVDTGYREVVVDWNPHGHPPPKVYTLPHFDFHFYMVGREQVQAVRFDGPGDPAARVSDSTIIPPDYKVIPETAIDRMGVHAIDTSGPEFHGRAFTTTFVYGYYQNRLIFLEPMVTRDFLLSRPSVSEVVKTPTRYSMGAYYPTRYSVRYEAGEQHYLIELAGLKHR